MSRKIIFIFIAILIIVGAIMLGVYFFSGTKATPTSTAPTNTSDYQQFNPFGSGTTIPTNNGVVEQPTETTPQLNQTRPTSKFRKITDFAIAGAAYFEEAKPIPMVIETTTPIVTPKTTTAKKVAKKAIQPEQQYEMIPSLRYVERMTGHIYNMNLTTNIVNKVSNSTIPSIYESIFDSKATTVIYRYLGTDNKTISSYMATLGGNQGEFLPSDIIGVSLSPDKSKFFYLTENQNGVTGSIRAFGDTKNTQVFSSPFTEWLPQWVTSQNIYLTTKPSSMVQGNIFSLNTSTGSLSKIFGGVAGLTTLANNDGSLILYSASLGTGPKLGLFNTSTRTSSDLGIYGLTDKCAWSSDNIIIYCAIPNTISGTQYPDYWYKGLVSFDDHFVRINTNTNTTTTIGNSYDETSADGINLFLDKAEGNLFFTNKKDSTLWSLNLR